jgi:hypothetical protein
MEQKTDFRPLGFVLGAIAGWIAVEIGAGLISGLFIGPIRADLYEQQYGTLFRVSLLLGPIAGAWIGHRIATAPPVDPNDIP